MHADGFGHRDDNYYVGNIGNEYVDVYTASSEVNGIFDINSDGIGIGGELGISALDIEAETAVIGYDNLNVKGNAEGEVLTAELSGDIRASINGVKVGGTIMANGATGTIGGDANIFGWNIKGDVTGYAGSFGGGLHIGLTKENGFTFGVKGAVLFGFGFNISIKF